MQSKEVALRKRSQIAKANRTMFLWIAGSSVLLGFSIVGAIFLGQKLFFNEKILAEKQTTISTLEKNNKAVPELESAVRVLDTDMSLSNLKAQEDDQAVQVVLDALPSTANSNALGGSLQDKLLAGIPNLVLQSLLVDPAADEASGEEGVSEDAVSGIITFRFTVAGDQLAFRQVLANLELSIRTIKVTSVNITSAGTTQVMLVSGEAYYESAKTIQLEDKVVRP